MKYFKYAIVLVIMSGLSSCNDFLTKEDPNKVDAPSYFRNETDLMTYSNGFLEKMLPDAEAIATGDKHCDYLGWRGPWNYLQANFDADDQGSWSWTQLRNINYYLDNMGSAECAPEVLRHYEGVGRFWRAYFYFEKVKLFGAVPWYSSVIDQNDTESLYKGRDSREAVMRNILEDINYAAENCLSSSALDVNSVQISKYVALGLKARICLYEGTYRKYHVNDPSTGRPWLADESAMYLRECEDACKKLMQSGRYKIENNAAALATQYRGLFTSEKVNTKEVVWARAYSGGLNVVHHLNSQFTNQQYGSYAVVKQFVDTYLNLDGTPYTSKAGYDVAPFWEEFKDRDLRLQQSICNPGFTRLDKGTQVLQVPNFNFSSTGYQPVKWLLGDVSFDGLTAPCNSSIPIIRYAEILLDYAEAKAELGEFSQAVWNETVKPLRERAGVTPLYPQNADRYMSEYFLNTVSDAALLEIRRERGTELFMENVRWDDCMRWHMGELLERDWYGMYVPAMDVNYDLNGDGKPDVCFVTKTPSPTVSGVQYREIGGDFLLTEQTKGYLVSYKNVERKWEDRKYVRPIPTTALNDNPNLGQNPGWSK